MQTENNESESYGVDQHIHVTIDADGEPVHAYRTLSQARDAVESDDYRHEDETEYAPDVPLMLPNFEDVDADELLAELQDGGLGE